MSGLLERSMLTSRLLGLVMVRMKIMDWVMEMTK